MKSKRKRRAMVAWVSVSRRWAVLRGARAAMVWSWWRRAAVMSQRAS